MNMLRFTIRSQARRYVFSLVLTSLAVVLRLSLRHVVNDHIPSEPFLLVIIVTTLLAGVGPALLSLFVSAFLIEYLFMEPYGTLTVRDFGDSLGLLIYFVLGTTIIWVCKQVIDDHELALVQKDRVENTMKLLTESEERFRSFAENSSEMFLILRKDKTIEYTNKSWERLTGRTQKDLYANPALLVELTAPEDRIAVQEHIASVVEHARSETLEFRYLRSDGSTGWLQVRGDVIVDSQGQPIKAIALAHDITREKLYNIERDLLMKRLSSSLEKVKLLSGLIPICAGCKKVRDDSGFWQQVEGYVRDHSEAEFTHSLCPDCMVKYGWAEKSANSERESEVSQQP